MADPRPPSLRRRIADVDYRRLAIALAIGTAGGAVFAYFRMPLAWMIGAMTFTSIAALSRLPVSVPIGLRSFFVSILGIMLGSAFRPSILDNLGEWVITLSGLLPYTAICTVLGLLYLTRLAGYSRTTAYFAAAPGGFNEMVMIGGSLGGDERTIALSHSLRVLLVVSIIPFWFTLLAGYQGGGSGSLGPTLAAMEWYDALLLTACFVGQPIARFLRFPAYNLTGPMLLSAAIHLAGVTDGTPPAILVALAQIMVGSAIGSRFRGVTWRQMGRIVVISIGLTAILLIMTVVMSLSLHAITGLSMVDLVLAYAPGGLAEMSLIALALDTDAAFVSTHHIFRILVILALAPLGFRLLDRMLGRRRPPPSGPGG